MQGAGVFFVSVVENKIIRRENKKIGFGWRHYRKQLVLKYSMLVEPRTTR